METKDYNVALTVNATPGDAFKKIAKIESWWRKDFKGDAENMDSAFTVPFGDPAFVNFKVAASEPGKKLVWVVTDCFLPWFKDQKEWNGTKVVWEIAGTDNTTQIKMTHVGLVPEVECYQVCETGWNGHINGGLLHFINENQVLPQ